MHVAEPDIEQRLELLPNARLVLEEGARILDGHVEHVGDARAAEAHLERLAVVALSLADLARHVDVGEKVHLDLHEAVALARLAAPALHVEREASRPVAADLRVRQLGEQLANGREQPRVRGRIRARRAADRALVDVDDLVDVLEPRDAIVLAGNHARAIEVARERVVQNVLDERRLSGPGNARDRDEQPQRYLSTEILQIVRARPLDPKRKALSRLPALRRDRDLHLTTQILSGERGGVPDHLVHGALGHDQSAVLSRAGTHVDQVVGLAHRLLIVLDHDHRVAEIAQLAKRREQPRVVALVQADRWLVEDVQHAHQPRTDLRREPNALRLAARQRFRRATEREIVEPDVDEEAQPLAHLLEDRTRDVLVESGASVLAHRHALEEAKRLGDRELGHLADVQLVDRDRERLGLEPAALTHGARRLDHELLELLAHAVGCRLVVAALHVREHAFPRALEVAAHRAGVHAKLRLLARRAVENQRARLRRERCPTAR